jgi:hypoxanthine phosphoribosyltransferase
MGKAELDRQSGAPNGAWKGLDPSVLPVFLNYDRTERMIAVLLERAVAWRPDVVVGITRGGLVAATMAATILAKPVAAIGYDRATGHVSWQGSPPAGKRVLLVDDACSTGATMARVREALLEEGRACLTLAVVHDPERTGFVPDLSHPMRALWRFPWERGEATPAGRALRATGAGPDRSTEAPFTAMDLEVLLLPPTDAALTLDLVAALPSHQPRPPALSMPLFMPEQAVLVTGRPESERLLIQRMLGRRGIVTPLHCRPDDTPDDARSVAAHKAAAALHWGCTHFIESDPGQAILIAAVVPHLIITWWPRESGRACVVSAAQSPL